MDYYFLVTNVLTSSIQGVSFSNVQISGKMNY